MKKRITKFEKFIVLLMLLLVVGTPLTTLTLSTLQLSYDREAIELSKEISLLKEENKNLETKKKEKLTYDFLQGVAVEGGLSARENSVKNIS